MKINPPFKKAVLLNRYKRFLADIRLNTGAELTIHCPNTGSMKNCWAPRNTLLVFTLQQPETQVARYP